MQPDLLGEGAALTGGRAFLYRPHYDAFVGRVLEIYFGDARLGEQQHKR
jgi:hypothetical protein